MAVNLNNISVDTNGRVTLGGISSGIDYQAAIDGIIKARRIPVDTGILVRGRPAHHVLSVRPPGQTRCDRMR